MKILEAFFFSVLFRLLCLFNLKKLPRESKVYILPVSELFISLQCKSIRKSEWNSRSNSFQGLLGNGKQPRGQNISHGTHCF